MKIGAKNALGFAQENSAWLVHNYSTSTSHPSIKVFLSVYLYIDVLGSKKKRYKVNLRSVHTAFFLLFIIIFLPLILVIMLIIKPPYLLHIRYLRKSMKNTP